MSQRAGQRSHLDLQVNLLAKREVSKILQMQRLICRRLQIEEADTDAEVADLSDATAVASIAHELGKKLTEGSGGYGQQAS